MHLTCFMYLVSSSSYLGLQNFIVKSESRCFLKEISKMLDLDLEDVNIQFDCFLGSLLRKQQQVLV